VLGQQADAVGREPAITVQPTFDFLSFFLFPENGVNF
jgi:hypothetical protein